MNYFNFLLLLILLTFKGFSQQINLNDAATLAKNFYYIHVNQVNEKNYNDIKIIPAYIHKNEANESVYFAFDINNEEGFIIISGSKDVKPVLAYSFKGKYQKDNLPPSVDMVMNYYSKQIEYSKTISQVNKNANTEWDYYLQYSPNKGLKDITTVSPLLKTTWNQTGYYNELCPEDSEASNGRVPVGCVAVAMGQTMKYYNYPQTGQGSNSYSYWWGWPYGTLSANFGTTTYLWDEMPNSLSSQNTPVAKLLYHCGVAVEMYYSATGSGANMSEAADKMVDNFKYSNSISLKDKSSYTNTNWNNLLKGQLDLLRPIMYSGSPQEGAGHAWVLDGYQGTDHFHMNWGWGGSMDGYFYLDNLVMNVNPGGEPLDLTYYQSAVTNIYPASNYPTYCSGTRLISGYQGSFEDGSGISNYQNNQNCSYIINPTCGTITNISFDEFNLEENDVVHIYDGTTVSSPLLASYYGGDVPISHTSSGNGMLIVFETNSTGTDQGWILSYSTDYCNSSYVTEEEFGTISDGSGSCDYMPSTFCKWVIQPPSANTITIDFTSFNIVDGTDNVKIYEGDLSNLVAIFKATSPPTEPIVVNSGVAIVRFLSGSNSSAAGWSFNYNSSDNSVSEKLLDNSFNVYPNPFNNDAKISYTLNNNSDITIVISDILGNELGTHSSKQIKGNNSLMISDFNINLNSGIYLVSLIIDNHKTVKKIICY
jgi:hypothetical protein